MFTVDHLNVFKPLPKPTTWNSRRRPAMLHFIDSSGSDDENLDELPRHLPPPPVVRRLAPLRHNMSRATSTINLKDSSATSPTSEEANFRGMMNSRRASCFELNKDDEFKVMAADKLLMAMENMKRAETQAVRWRGTSTESLPGIIPTKNRRQSKGPLEIFHNLMAKKAQNRSFMVGPPTLISSTVSLHEITVRLGETWLWPKHQKSLKIFEKLDSPFYYHLIFSHEDLLEHRQKAPIKRVTAVINWLGISWMRWEKMVSRRVCGHFCRCLLSTNTWRFLCWFLECLSVFSHFVIGRALRSVCTTRFSWQFSG